MLVAHKLVKRIEKLRILKVFFRCHASFLANIFSKDSSPLYEEDWNPDRILSIFER